MGPLDFSSSGAGGYSDQTSRGARQKDLARLRQKGHGFRCQFSLKSTCCHEWEILSFSQSSKFFDFHWG